MKQNIVNELVDREYEEPFNSSLLEGYHESIETTAEHLNAYDYVLSEVQKKNDHKHIWGFRHVARIGKVLMLGILKGAIIGAPITLPREIYANYKRGFFSTKNGQAIAGRMLQGMYNDKIIEGNLDTKKLIKLKVEAFMSGLKVNPISNENRLRINKCTVPSESSDYQKYDICKINTQNTFVSNHQHHTVSNNHSASL
jgi:hypothetical protein